MPLSEGNKWKDGILGFKMITNLSISTETWWNKPVAVPASICEFCSLDNAISCELDFTFIGNKALSNFKPHFGQQESSVSLHKAKRLLRFSVSIVGSGLSPCRPHLCHANEVLNHLWAVRGQAYRTLRSKTVSEVEQKHTETHTETICRKSLTLRTALG